ncbi:potassium channel family protein [Deinococcus roseus]|uniref:Potassium channel n=1 Tax=Deinococcus roseus TaxID=392414 RepID=A0ABQ2CW60_9DEIO|nr:potassium channel protein [Deinococcus roseus]GGJ25508.1 potassium channel [Deinococcus roseus]
MPRQLQIALLLILLVQAMGTLGYMVLEDMSFTDAMFQTIMILTTVGLGEVNPFSTAGKWLSIGLMSFGVGLVLYSLTQVVEVLITNAISDQGKLKKERKHMQKLQDHIVVCGYGRVGEQVSRELHAAKQPFLILDHRPERAQAARNAGFLVLEGDANQDEVLLQAGIDRARTLVAVLGEDAMNLYVVLSARELSPGLHIVARSSEDTASKKLMRAGANEVINLHRLSGVSVARGLLKSSMVSVLEDITFGAQGFQMEGVQVASQSALIGKHPREVQLMCGITFIALKRASGEVYRYETDLLLMAGDTLLVIGNPEEVKKLELLSIRSV